MKKVFFLLALLILCVLRLASQQDTIFLSYSSPTNIHSINTEVVPIDEGYLVVNYNFLADRQYYSLIKTDFNGQVTNRLDSITLEGHTIDDLQHVEYTDDGFILYSNLSFGGNNNAFVSYKISLDLSTVTTLDFIALDKDKLYFRDFKYNKHLNCVEGFGIIKNSISGQFTDNIYVRGDIQGNFNKFQKLQLFTPIRPVMDFVWLDIKKQYFIALGNRNSYLLNDSLAVLAEIE